MKNSLIQLGFGVLVGFLIGYFAVSHHLDSPFVFLVLWISVLICLYIQIIIHEGGHLLFGLLTGYQLISFRIGKFMWVKEENGYQFKKFGVIGTGGQCLMIPPTNSKAFFLYNAGGVILNLTTSLIAILLAYQTSGALSAILFGFAIPGIYFGLMNGIPLMFQVANDGYNIKMILKDKRAIDALYAQLRAAHQMSEGVRAKDIPLYEIPSDADLNNPLFSTMYCINISHHLDEGNYDLYRQQTETILQYKIMDFHRISLLNDLLMNEAMRCDNVDELKQYATKKVKSKVNLANNPLIAYIVYTLIDKDEKKAKQAQTQFEKSVENHPYPAEANSLKKAMEYIQAKYCSSN